MKRGVKRAITICDSGVLGVISARTVRSATLIKHIDWGVTIVPVEEMSRNSGFEFEPSVK
jgi:hypothetical protein